MKLTASGLNFRTFPNTGVAYSKWNCLNSFEKAGNICSLITERVNLMNADWSRQRASFFIFFFFNVGKITRSWWSSGKSIRS